jgi:hypothetical protein
MRKEVLFVRANPSATRVRTHHGALRLASPNEVGRCADVLGSDRVERNGDDGESPVPTSGDLSLMISCVAENTPTYLRNVTSVGASVRRRAGLGKVPIGATFIGDMPTAEANRAVARINCAVTESVRA